MMQIPMLEEQIAKAEFLYENFKLVAISQTSYDMMYEKLEVPKGAPLFQTSTLDTMAVLNPK